MTRYRLRHNNTDLELHDGDFVVGRSSSCSLALDDALVSRQHARLRVEGRSIQVEDLRSRNGVLVNGERLMGPKSLHHLDRISIGSSELLLLETGRSGAEKRARHATLAGATLEVRISDHHELVTAEEDETRQATGFELVAGIAHKALSLRRFDEAERLLQKHLDVMLEKARVGQLPDSELQTAATDFALRLAEGTGRTRWLDWIFDFGAACRAIPNAATVDALHNAVRALRYDDARALRRYLKSLHQGRESLPPARRFVLRRLEGLEKVISA